MPWAARWLGGLEILAPGYQKVRHSPPAVGGLEFSMTVPTPHGEIEIENGRLRAPDGVEVIGCT